jgi:hypothetical protein
MPTVTIPFTVPSPAALNEACIRLPAKHLSNLQHISLLFYYSQRRDNALKNSIKIKNLTNTLGNTIKLKNCKQRKQEQEHLLILLQYYMA